MFRKIAIALVAASALTAPVLAQTPGESKLSPSATAPTSGTAEKTDKLTTKPITKHHIVVRHHRHGTKMVKVAKYGKFTRHMKHGKITAKQISGARASVKSLPSKPAAKPGLD